MHFGKYLRVFRHPLWAEHYLSYGLLKELLDDLLEEEEEEKQDKMHRETFMHLLHEDLERISVFFLKKKEEVEATFDKARALIVKIEDHRTAGGSEVQADHLENLKNAEILLKRIYCDVLLLRDFSSLNYTGITKILKKHDKMLPRFACRASFIKKHANPLPVFGLLDSLFRLQQECCLAYADLYLEGNRMSADIKLGSHFIETHQPAKTKKQGAHQAYIYATSTELDDLNLLLMNSPDERKRKAKKKKDERALPPPIKHASTASSLLMRTQSRLNVLRFGTATTTTTSFAVMVASLALIMLGGVGQSISLEYIVRNYRGCGATVSFFQFLFVAVEGARKYIHYDPTSRLRVRFRQRRVPLQWHIAFLLFSWGAAVLASCALEWNISVASSMIIKSCILLVNMALGATLLRKKYSLTQGFAILVLTAGVVLYTIVSIPGGGSTYPASSATGSNPTGDSSSSTTTGVASEQAMPGVGELLATLLAGDLSGDITIYVVGLLMMCGSLVCTGLIGVTQDMIYRTYGREWKELMFYAHFFGLALFVFFAHDIYSHLVLWTYTSPLIWVYLAVNTFSQFLCIKGIYEFISVTNSLTGSFVMTIRKFVLVVVSVLVFENTFTLAHWLSVLLVLIGTLLYTNAPQPEAPAPVVARKVSTGGRRHSERATDLSTRRMSFVKSKKA